MKTKLLLFLFGGLLIGAEPATDNSAIKEVEQAIRVLNEAFVKRDPEVIRRLMTDDHIAITPYYGGPHLKAEQLQTLKEHQVTDYKAEETQISLLAKDVALVRYKLTQKGTYQGKSLAPKNYASAVWVKRDGKWLEATYQETPL